MNIGRIDMDRLRSLARESGIPTQELEGRLQDLGISDLSFCTSTL